MPDQPVTAPDSTAVRVALWRALHVLIDPPPHVLKDEIGLQLIAPDEGWRRRPDMDPQGTRGYRASIIGRARFIEDVVLEQADRGVDQYVILGSGLDTFAQRRPDVASRLKIFEVDRAGAQAWKLRRLMEAGFGVPEYLRLVSVDFEAKGSWWDQLSSAGFDKRRPTFVASTGVSMYLTRDAVVAMFRQIAALAPGSQLAMTFLLPLELLDPVERPQHQMVYERARAAGTPFVSFFRPEEILQLAVASGFADAKYISTEDITKRYFAGRTDGLRPSSGEAFLLATV